MSHPCGHRPPDGPQMPHAQTGTLPSSFHTPSAPSRGPCTPECVIRPPTPEPCAHPRPLHVVSQPVPFLEPREQLWSPRAPSSPTALGRASALPPVSAFSGLSPSLAPSELWPRPQRNHVKLKGLLQDTASGWQSRTEARPPHPLPLCLSSPRPDASVRVGDPRDTGEHRTASGGRVRVQAVGPVPRAG